MRVDSLPVFAPRELQELRARALQRNHNTIKQLRIVGVRKSGPRYHFLRPVGNSLVRVSRGVSLPHFPRQELEEFVHLSTALFAHE